MTLILIILLILLLCGGYPVYARAPEWGYGPTGVVGLLLTILLIVLILRLCGVWV